MAEESIHSESAIEQKFVSVLEGSDTTPETDQTVNGESVVEEIESDEIEADQAEDSEVEEPEQTEETEEVIAKYLLPIGENGEDIELDASEVKDYLLRQKDYTQKTQNLSEQRKQLDAERNSIRAIQHLGSELKKEFETLRQSEELAPNQEYWDRLKIDNPMQYMIEKQEHQDRLMEQNAKMRKLDQLQTQMEQQQALEFQQNLLKEQQHLASAIPEWEDPEVAQRERQALRLYGLSQNYKDLLNRYDGELHDIAGQFIKLAKKEILAQEEELIQEEQIEKKKLYSPKPTKGPKGLSQALAING